LTAEAILLAYLAVPIHAVEMTAMNVHLDIPDDIARRLMVTGGDLSRGALELRRRHTGKTASPRRSSGSSVLKRATSLMLCGTPERPRASSGPELGGDHSEELR